MYTLYARTWKTNFFCPPKQNLKLRPCVDVFTEKTNQGTMCINKCTGSLT